jgi:hypothetical protein
MIHGTLAIKTAVPKVKNVPVRCYDEESMSIPSTTPHGNSEPISTSTQNV